MRDASPRPWRRRLIGLLVAAAVLTGAAIALAVWRDPVLRFQLRIAWEESLGPPAEGQRPRWAAELHDRAVRNLQHLNSAQDVFYERHSGGRYGSLAELRGRTLAPHDVNRFPDPLVARAYAFEVVVTEDGQDFEAVFIAETLKVPSLFTDRTGVLRVARPGERPTRRSPPALGCRSDAWPQ